MRMGLAAAVALVAIAPGMALAQTQRQAIELKAGENYTHKHTELTVPAALDDLPRTGGIALAAEQLDEILTFQSGNESVSVYIFRNVAGSVPVWFDRSSWAIEHRPDVYGNVTPLDRAPAFAPPGQQSRSALSRVWLTGKGPFRSTGLAFIPLGDDWFVKIRYSSATHSAEALAPRLTAVIGALGWPDSVKEQEAAEPVTECTTPLAFTGTAKPLKTDGAESLMSSLLVAATSDPSIKKEPAGPPPNWCRDPGIAADGTRGVYRANGSTDAYLLAIGDAGRAVFAGRDEMAELVAKKKGKARFSISLVNVDKTYFFTPHDRLPDPAQAIKIVQGGQVTSSATTWGKSNVTIDPSTLK